MAKLHAQQDAAGVPGLVEHAFNDLRVLGDAADASRAATSEANRLAADIALAQAEVTTRTRRTPRPRIWGLDARLFVADLHRMHREIRPGH
ncbi:MAG: hypothetical protein Q7T55_20955 [Solirubrobacteraceae bacterium]|nr:hypothetical protein [Solirubrobacteraceae bacterium]